MPRPDPVLALLPSGPRGSAATAAAWEFSRIEEFWGEFRPLCPYGKDFREERRVFSGRPEIEAQLDLTEAWLDFEQRVLSGGARESGRSVLDRLAYHVGRIPRLPDAALRAEGPPLDLIEIFLVKKFVSNTRAIACLLDEAARKAFRFVIQLDDLAAELGKGGSDAETFFVSDAYDPELKKAREALSSIDGEKAGIRGRSLAAAASLGFDFRGREFLVVPHAQAKSLIAERSQPQEDRGPLLFSVEPYDAASYLLRLEPSADELALDERRDVLLAEEKRLEASALAGLSGLVRGRRAELERAAEGLGRLDLARARAALVSGKGLSRPVFLEGAESGLSIKGGRLLPLESECSGSGMRYTPLDLELGERVAVVFGSNMGGKTVALETALFLQLLAQSGFHVPASRYETEIFPFIHYVGELVRPGHSGFGGGGGRPAASGGLSGFGYEIRSLVEAEKAARDGGFIAFDEFARTTGSREAESLLSALLESFSGRRGMRCLFSTHFHGVARIPGVRYLRMKGLDRAAASRALESDDGLSELVRAINGMMEYALVDDDGSSGSDAIAIARLLGLEPSVADRAERLAAYSTHNA